MTKRSSRKTLKDTFQMIEGFKRLVKYLRARDKESMNSKGEGGSIPSPSQSQRARL